MNKVLIVGLFSLAVANGFVWCAEELVEVQDGIGKLVVGQSSGASGGLSREAVFREEKAIATMLNRLAEKSEEEKLEGEKSSLGVGDWIEKYFDVELYEDNPDLLEASYKRERAKEEEETIVSLNLKTGTWGRFARNTIFPSFHDYGVPVEDRDPRIVNKLEEMIHAYVKKNGLVVGRD